MLIKTLKEYDSLYLAHNTEGQIEGESVFEFCNRGSRVILSAPHATLTESGGYLHKCDLFTGAITKLLGELYGFSTLIRCKYTPGSGLVNRFVAENHLTSHYFLDIHAMSESAAVQLAIGTGYYPATEYQSEINLINQLAKTYKISRMLNHPSYRGSPGLTGYLQREFHSKKVLQLEWRKDMRNFYDYPENVCEKLFPFIRELAGCLEKSETEV